VSLYLLEFEVKTVNFVVFSEMMTVATLSSIPLSTLSTSALSWPRSWALAFPSGNSGRA